MKKVACLTAMLAVAIAAPAAADAEPPSVTAAASKWNMYADHSKVGYAQGPNGGAVAAAALLLAIV